jgi:hypothetical protein
MEKQLAQEKERCLVAPAEYDKADSAAMKLLTKLSKAEAYYKRDRPAPCKDYAQGAIMLGGRVRAEMKVMRLILTSKRGYFKCS